MDGIDPTGTPRAVSKIPGWLMVCLSIGILKLYHWYIKHRKLYVLSGWKTAVYPVVIVRSKVGLMSGALQQEFGMENPLEFFT